MVKKELDKIKIGSIIKDRSTGHYGIVVEKYKGSDFDWEVFPLPHAGVNVNIFKDCSKEIHLSLRSRDEYCKSILTHGLLKEVLGEFSFWKRLKLIFRRNK